MLHLSQTTKAPVAAVPTNVTTLSVSWLNSQFKAAAIQRGVVEGTWEHAGEIEGAQHFERLLREAIQQTGYRGTTVSLVLAHPRLSQQLLETPPLRGPALAKFVQTQAKQQKLFEGEAASAYQPAFSGEGAQRLVLHLFPRVLLDQLVQAAQRNDLFLTSVLPATAVLQAQLPQLPMEKEGIAVLAAHMGPTTTVIIGRNDAQVLLARTLNGSWTADAARLAVDLSRTILFVNQQYGVAVDKGVWLFGLNAKDHFVELQRHIQVPVKLSPVEFAPFYWATEALKLPLGQTPNFISLELQKAPQRRTMLKLTTAITLAVVLACLAGSFWCYWQSRAVRANQATLRAQELGLQARHQELRHLQAELLRKQQAVQRVLDNRPPPRPAWFMAALSEAVPTELVLTNLQVQRDTDCWKVNLGGVLQPSAAAAAPQLPTLVSVLKTRLSGSPFHLKFADETMTNLATPARSAVFASWPARESKPTAAKLQPMPNFALQGVMR